MSMPKHPSIKRIEIATEIISSLLMKRLPPKTNLILTATQEQLLECIKECEKCPKNKS